MPVAARFAGGAGGVGCGGGGARCCQRDRHVKRHFQPGRYASPGVGCGCGYDNARPPRRGGAARGALGAGDRVVGVQRDGGAGVCRGGVGGGGFPVRQHDDHTAPSILRHTPGRRCGTRRRRWASHARTGGGGRPALRGGHPEQGDGGVHRRAAARGAPRVAGGAGGRREAGGRRGRGLRRRRRGGAPAVPPPQRGVDGQPAVPLRHRRLRHRALGRRPGRAVAQGPHPRRRRRGPRRGRLARTAPAAGPRQRRLRSRGRRRHPARAPQHRPLRHRGRLPRALGRRRPRRAACPVGATNARPRRRPCCCGWRPRSSGGSP